MPAGGKRGGGGGGNPLSKTHPRRKKEKKKEKKKKSLQNIPYTRAGKKQVPVHANNSVHWRGGERGGEDKLTPRGGGERGGV